MAPGVEFKTFRVNYNDRPELVPLGADLRPIRYSGRVQGICLSKNEYLQEVEAGLRDGLKTFEPVGVWLDYLTYAGWFETPAPDFQESCFCSACVAEFCEAENVDAAAPDQILQRYRSLWTSHKCRRVAELASGYSSIIREIRPNCVVGAYMCPYTPSEYDGALSRVFGQVYELFAAAVDVFTPLIYARKSGRRNDWGRRFLALCPGFIPKGRKVQLILDNLDYPGGLADTAESEVPTWGFQLFAGGEIFLDPSKRTVFRSAVQSIKSRIVKTA